ncbi:MAG: prepilin-type N-terminal cleavage/methylation domain-containing protein [Myxococcota bacterium]
MTDPTSVEKHPASRRHRRHRRHQRGLTIVEVMLTAAVLGIGIVAVVATYNRTQVGVRSSRFKTSALRIAQQRLEYLATMPIGRLAACAGPVTGCQRDRSAMAPVLGNVGNYRCTQNVDGMGFHDPTALATGQYRIDTSVQPHPDPRQQAGAVVVTVSVCWTAQPGLVEQVQVQRMVVPEV